MAVTVTELRARLKLNADKAGFDKAKKAVSSLKDNLKKLAFASAAAAAGLVAVTKGVSDQIREVGILSKRFGINTQALQVWLSLAKRAGVESSQFADGIKDFTIKLGQSKKATDPAAVALKKLGLNFRQLKKDSPEERLDKVLKALNKVEDASQRAALAAAIAGDTGGQTFITLAAQAKNYGAEKKNLTQAGAIITPADERAANDMANSLHELDIAVFSIKKTIATALVPIIKKLSKELTVWLGNNKKLIGQKVEKIAQGIANVFTTLAPLIGWAAENVDKLVLAWVAFKGVQIGIALFEIISFLIALFAAEGTVAVGATAMWIAITGPIGIAIALIVALVAAIILIWKNFDTIKAAAKAVGRVIVKVFKGVIDGVMAAFKFVLDAITAVLKFYIDIYTRIGKAIAKAFDIVVLDKFKSALDGIASVASEVVDFLGLGGGAVNITKIAKTIAPSVTGVASRVRPSNVNRTANTVSIAKPGQVSVEAPEVTNNIRVFLGTKDIKEISKQETRILMDKQVREAAPR